MNIQDDVPEVGKDVSWEEVLSLPFRVVDFDRNETIITEHGEVKATSEHNPYGYLLVCTPTVTGQVVLPICHKDDFKLASSVFDDTDVLLHNRTLSRELLVIYQPEQTTPDGRAYSIWHFLHFALAPAGTLDDYFNKELHGTALLFGLYTEHYRGDLSVFMNPGLYEQQRWLNENVESLNKLVVDAILVISEKNKASTSLFKKELNVGYGTAVRIMERLEEMGIVGKSDGLKPRTINLPKL